MYSSWDRPPTRPTLFFFNDTPTTEIYTLSLHDALPISRRPRRPADRGRAGRRAPLGARPAPRDRARPATLDRKSTRLNSSHSQISYAVFCLKKKNTEARQLRRHRPTDPVDLILHTPLRR